MIIHFFICARHWQQLYDENPLSDWECESLYNDKGGIVKFNLKEVWGKILIWGYELHIKLTKVGRGCKSKQSLTLPETLEVNVEDIWDEGCCSYLVRSYRYIANKDERLKQ